MDMYELPPERIDELKALGYRVQRSGPGYIFIPPGEAHGNIFRGFDTDEDSAWGRADQHERKLLPDVSTPEWVTRLDHWLDPNKPSDSPTGE